MIKKLVSILVWVVGFQLISFYLGLMTQADIATWYPSLQKSSLTPPAIVFPIVWFVLYIMIAIAGWSLWQSRKEQTAQIPLWFYGAQLIMNWTWTPLFFHWHLIGFSFFWIIGIAIFTLLTIMKTQKQYKLASYLLIPYFLWSLFAAYLNGVIWVLN